MHILPHARHGTELTKEDTEVIRRMPMWGIIGIVLLASGLILGPNVAQAQFDNSDLEGVWVLSASGTITMAGGPAPVGTPLIAVGLFEFDGAGACRGIDQLNIGGMVLPDPNNFRTTAGDGSCRYIVNSNGTGFMEVVFGPSQPLPGTIQLTFGLIENEEFKFITTITPGFSAIGTFTKQVDDDD